MLLQMNKIDEARTTRVDYTLNLFNALSTTNNDEFRSFINTEKNNWETSTVVQTV